MRKLFLALCFITAGFITQAQVTTIADQYKIIDIGSTGYGDYTKSLILLHEVYNGTLIGSNYAIGTITALRGSAGSWNRFNVVNINASSAYNQISGALSSYDNYSRWKLKTCIYNGKKYLAVEIPYNDSYHDHGYKFAGWTVSTGENMKAVAYEVNGQPVNQSLLSEIQDYNANITETHSVAALNILGNVGIGTTAPDEKLSVNGKIRAKEIKVETSNWPDYVFDGDYKLRSLSELENFIKENQHLPEILPAKEAETEGISLGEMNAKLLKKIEELTLYIIAQNKQFEIHVKELSEAKNRITGLTNQVESLSKKFK